MALKKQWSKSTAKATAAAQADESVALSEEAIAPPKKKIATKSESGTKAPKSNEAKETSTLKDSAVSSPAKPKAVKTPPKAKTKTSLAKGEKDQEASVAKSLPIAKEKSLKGGAIKGSARVLDSQVAFEGPLFRVLRDHLIEPSGRESHRDVIRHNGSVVILAVDHGPEKKHSGKDKKKNKKDPWIVIERQYRHAAGQYLWELPAGKLEAGEVPLDGAKRELGEETGYKAEKWSPLVEYYASPGFLGEAMKVFLAEDLVAGDAHPEEDENIDFRLVRLSEILKMVDKGKIIDGKTLTSILLYARQLGVRHRD